MRLEDYKEKWYKNEFVINWLSWTIAIFILYSSIIVLHIMYPFSILLGFLSILATYCCAMSFVLLMLMTTIVLWVAFDMIRQKCRYFVIKVLLNIFTLSFILASIIFVGYLGLKYYDFLVYLGGLINA